MLNEKISIMGKIHLLDCTLRDGGYVNNWEFGEDTIKSIVKKLEATGIEMIELGFMREQAYNPNQSLFPTVQSFQKVIEGKKNGVLYVGMIDMGNPVSLDTIPKCDHTSVDGLRVIFKKSKLKEAYDYCKALKEKGYCVFVNFVNTDQYSEQEWTEAIEYFAPIHADGVTIVDTFGSIKRKQFIRLAELADGCLEDGVMLCYHAHNNLQQAFANAEALVDLNLERDICIDACVFGMGRGAGNLNLELFAEFLNETCGKNYRIAPMLQIMDEHLTAVYKEKFWGYSLPLYLSARRNAHPNYAIYFAEKNDLPVKAFDEILRSMSDEDKIIFREAAAERYYQSYLENYVDDKQTVARLSDELSGKKVLLIAPGSSIAAHQAQIEQLKREKDVCTVLINFYDERFAPDYIFCTNLRRVAKIPQTMKERMIATSNVNRTLLASYVVNLASYTSTQKQIYANGGLIALKVMRAVGVKEVFVAGMDGYSDRHADDYFDKNMKLEHSSEAEQKNKLIGKELAQLSKSLKITFITPTKY